MIARTEPLRDPSRFQKEAQLGLSLPRHFSALAATLCRNSGGLSTAPAAELAEKLATPQYGIGPEDQLEISVEPGFPRLMIRRRGGNIAMYGPDGQVGALLENVAPQNLRNAVVLPYDSAIEERRAYFSRVMPNFLRGDRSAVDRLIIPCAPGDGTVTSILAINLTLSEEEALEDGSEELLEATRRGRPIAFRPCGDCGVGV